MLILEQLRQLLELMNNDSISLVGKLALGNFILCSISLISFLNIIIYIIIIKILDKEFVLEKIQRYKYINKIFMLYKHTRTYFILFEVCLILFINIFILWQSYILFSNFL